jgi:hypothetical protein
LFVAAPAGLQVKGRRRRIMNERTREDGERRTAVVTPRRPRVLLRLLCEARSEGREHVPNPLRRTEALKRIIVSLTVWIEREIFAA